MSWRTVSTGKHGNADMVETTIEERIHLIINKIQTHVSRLFQIIEDERKKIKKSGDYSK